MGLHLQRICLHHSLPLDDLQWMQYAFYAIGVTPYFRESQEQPLVYVQTFLKKIIFSHRLSEFTNAQPTVTLLWKMLVHIALPWRNWGSVQDSQDGGAVMLDSCPRDTMMEPERKATTRKCLRSDTWWTSSHMPSGTVLKKGYGSSKYQKPS